MMHRVIAECEGFGLERNFDDGQTLRLQRSYEAVMKKWSLIAGVGVVLVTWILWIARGCHTGLTHNTAYRSVPDPITGLTGLVPEPAWIPGIDFLGWGFLWGAVIAAIGWIGDAWRQASGNSSSRKK